MTVRAKLAARLVPVAMIAVVLMTLLSRKAVERVLIDEVRRGLKTLAVSFVDRPVTADRVARGRDAELRPRLDELVRGASADRAAVLDLTGRVVSHTDQAEGGKTYPWALSAKPSRVVRVGDTRYEEIVVPVHRHAEGAHPIKEGEELVGYLLVGGSIEPAMASARRIGAGVFVVVALIMIGTLAVSLAFVRRALRPVAQLADATRRLGAGEFAVQAPVVSNDEIGELAKTFNAMSRRLADVTVSKEFLDSILEGMIEGLIVTEPDGVIRLLNARALELLGGRDLDWIGRAIGVALPGAADCMQKGERCMGLEGLMRNFSGAEIPVLYGVAPISGRGKGFAVTFADITLRKAAEEELTFKARELERSNRELEQFAYVASHDLQEPLRKVANFTELLAKRYKGKLGSDADQFVEYIIDGVHRMRALIQDLLAFSRAGRGERFADAVDMNAVASEAISNVEQALTDSDASVEVGKLPKARGDAERLVQVLQNLLGNAAKFRHPDRRLSIKIGGKDQGEECLYWVEDNGIGIEPQYREKVFVIFQRLHSRREYAGTGIGLAICRRVVELHGGRIWIETPASGVGTRFAFTISKRRVPTGEKADGSKIQSAHGRGR